MDAAEITAIVLLFWAELIIINKYFYNFTHYFVRFWKWLY